MYFVYIFVHILRTGSEKNKETLAKLKKENKDIAAPITRNKQGRDTNSSEVTPTLPAL